MISSCLASISRAAEHAFDCLMKLALTIPTAIYMNSSLKVTFHGAV